VPTSEPGLELVSILFRMTGATGRPSRCAVYRVDTVVELRLEYEDVDNDVERSRLFHVRDDEAMASVADRWRLTLREKGFEELPALEP
jgi:hypothetical protein